MNKSKQRYTNTITILLWNIFLQNTCCILLGSQNPFEKIPTELKKCILSFCMPTDGLKYKISQPIKKNSEFLIPNSIRPINLLPIKDSYFEIMIYDFNIEKKQKNSYLLNEQCILKKFLQEKENLLKLSKNKEKIIKTFCLPYFKDSEYHFAFDGFSNNHMAIFAAIKQHISSIYYLSIENSHIPNDLKIKKPFLEIPGYIHFIALNKEGYTFSYSSIEHTNTDSSYETPLYHWTIVNIQDNRTVKSIGIHTPFVLKKTIYLGQETYLGLTEKGHLVVLWQQHDGSIKYAKQKHHSTFLDIAVDNTVQTARGFNPHIAFLNDKKEIFISNLLWFTQPTLFFLAQINDGSYHHSLFYDKGTCGVLYKNANTDTDVKTYFESYPDNIWTYCILDK